MSFNAKPREPFLFFLLSLIVIGIAYQIFPQKLLRANVAADNPKACPYYISLQSLLANQTLLASDAANSKLIRQRLLTFEQDSKNLTAPSLLQTKLQQQYRAALKKINVTTIANLSAAEIILIAKNVAPSIDHFYLDIHDACNQPLYDWKPNHSRRILQYNLGNLYDRLPNRFMRIMGATEDAFQLGIFPGFFVNNQSTTLGTQFMSGTPLLTALYVQPHDHFANLGSYAAPVPWNFFRSQHFIDPSFRKLMDIAGIDVVSVYQDELGKRHLPATQKLPHDVSANFSTVKRVRSFINLHSYGMAYLANHIRYADLAVVLQQEKIIKEYFAQPDRHTTPQFLNARNIFYKQLQQLSSLHDVIIEASAPRPLQQKNLPQAGKVTINGIVAERGLFTANCKRAQCTFVANIAYAPGWWAFVNGKPAKIERANFAFMATTIPQATSSIWLIYEPWYRLVSYFLSIGALILLFVFRHWSTQENL